MTFTVDSALIATSARQQVRHMIGDIDVNKPLLTDEQIDWRLGQYNSSPSAAAIPCVRDILGKLAREVDRNAMGMSASRSQQITHYKDLLEELKADAGSLAEIYVGGTSDSEAETINSDEDYRKVAITLGWGKNQTETDGDDE